MLHLVFYFQVHQPYRLANYHVLQIAKENNFFDDRLNGEVIRKVGDKCYLPANRVLLDLINRYEGRFKVAFSITGVAIEQFRQYYPEVLDSFRELARTGCVEFLTETYYHSLSFLYDKEEFLTQIKMHSDLMMTEFGSRPIVFRNTELIYQDDLSSLIADHGFKVVLAEGADKVLNWRSPLYTYKTRAGQLLLCKYYSLSDDIAFRFSNRDWPEFPLTSEKFAEWVSKLSLVEHENRNLFLNLFMDYETFGEHQWDETGIFKFMQYLPGAIFKYPHLAFAWPSDAVEITNYEPHTLPFPHHVSWADTERDLSAWLENDMQKNAADALYEILAAIKSSGRVDLLESARRLSTSDHLYYMCTKYFQDGDVHKYFSPYTTPEQAYIFFMNAIANLRNRL